MEENNIELTVDELVKRFAEIQKISIEEAKE